MRRGPRSGSLVPWPPTDTLRMITVEREVVVRRPAHEVFDYLAAGTRVSSGYSSLRHARGSDSSAPFGVRSARNA